MLSLGSESWVDERGDLEGHRHPVGQLTACACFEARLQAFGRVGYVLRNRGGNWKRPLKRLADIDWARANKKTWEGRALIGGKVSKSGNSIILTTNAIKTVLDLPLSEEEQLVEQAFTKETS